MDEMLKVSGLCKDYELYNKTIDRLKEALDVKKRPRHDTFHALSNISFSVGKGETVGVIGTNGSGKSTLLKIITGVVTPSAGKVEVSGKISALLELGAGFNPDYTGMQNIYLNGTITGYSTEQVDAMVDSIISFANIGEFIHQPVKTYSSGMFARLAFAVAISVKPDILIVDEALSVGDVFFQSKCFKKIEEMQKSGTTILLVSHDLGSITQYCTRAILLNKGKMIKEGKPKEVVDLYKKILVNQFHGDGEKPYEKTALNREMTEEEWKKSIQISPEMIEYGSKQAEITDFAVVDCDGNITTVIEKGTEFAIKMRIAFHQAIDHPIFAIMIKDRKGNELSGTNTMVEKIDTGNPTAGALISVSFRQKMDLQGGVYLLSLGCTNFEAGNLVVYHRLYDVCSIEVLAQKNSVGVYDMNSAISVDMD